KQMYYGILRSEDTSYSIMDSDLFDIDLSEDVTNDIDAVFKTPILSGSVFLPDSVTPVTNEMGVIVELDGQQYNVVDGAYSIDIFELDQGSNSVFAIYSDENYDNSNAIQFSTEDFVDGTLTQDISITDKVVSNPIEIVYNEWEYLPTYWDHIEINVGLRNLNTSSVDDISVQLIPFDDPNEGTPVVLTYNTNEHRDLFNDGDYYKYSTRLELSEALTAGDSYILRITDNSANPSKSVDTIVYATDASIIEGSNYIGSVDGEIWHKLYFIYDQTATGDVTVYNANDEPVGSGSIEVFDERFHDVLMKTTLDEGAVPSYFEFNGTLVRGNGNEYYTTATNDDYLWEVTADDTNYYIKMYNDDLATDYVTGVKIDESNGPTLFDAIPDNGFSVDVMTNADSVNGLIISIPITEFEGNKWCSITIYHDGGEDGRGDYFFEDNSQSILSIVTKDPTDTTVIQDVEAAFSHRTENTTSQFDVIEGKFVLTQADDGEYQVYMSSSEQDTYGLSDGFVFKIIGGVAYNEAGDTPLDNEIVLNLNEGIKIGDVYDASGNLTNEGFVGISRIIDNNGNRDWCGHARIKPNGSMYITKADGTYEISLESWTDSFGESIAVTISGDTITGGRDMSFGPMQLSGEVFLEAGTPFTDYNYWVEVLDDNRNYITDSRKVDNNMSNFYYQVGGLKEGTYYVVLHPEGDLQDQGYASSEEVEIVIDANGDATPRTA
ncbi:MAG: hypothetical protein PF505_00285, partial [Vallitaleaceae bacterium]|nr:hypothetical protein [Vallitaleaceae bacterium]